MSNFTHIAWTDLETTGLNHETDELLEVGIILTDLELNVIGERDWLVKPRRLDLLSLHPDVLKMHTANGLLDAILAEDRRPRVMNRHDSWLPDDVDWKIGDWVREVMNEVAPEGWQLALGGSGVSHFDVRWIKKHLPGFARILWRSTVDVGVIRRFIEHVVQRPELIPEKPLELTHRALDDARNHLAEARHYREVFS